MRTSDFVRGAWRKLPVETAIVAMTGAGAIGAYHDSHELWWVRLVLAGLVVTPLAFAAHRLGVRRQATMIGAITAAILVLLAVCLNADTRPDSQGFSYPYGLCALASLLVPFVTARRQFTHFVRRFFEETTTWGLLWGGAMAAIGILSYALHELFDLDVSHLGVDVLITCVTGAFVLVYLDRLRTADTATPGRMPELWRRLATTIGAPFVCAMLAILVVYELSVVVRGELPRNTLSPLILGAGLVGFVSTLIVSAVLGEAAPSALQPAERHMWARSLAIRVMRGFPIVLLVLLPMAGWALWLRIDEHGLTPLRVVRAYGVLCLAVLSVAGAWRCVRGRGALTWQVPAVLLVGALVAALGPFSAVRLSVRSQAAELAHRLDALGVGRVVASQEPPVKVTLDWDQLDPLASRVDLLVELAGEAGLRRVLTGDLSMCNHVWGGRTCLDHLGVRETEQAALAASSQVARHNITGARIEAQAGAVIFVDTTRSVAVPLPSAEVIANAEALFGGVVLTASELVVFRHGARLGAVSLAAFLTQPGFEMPSRALPVISATGAVIGEFALRQLGVQHNGDHDEAVEAAGTLLLR
jgi:hypothetical protein